MVLLQKKNSPGFDVCFNVFAKSMIVLDLQFNKIEGGVL